MFPERHNKRLEKDWGGKEREKKEEGRMQNKTMPPRLLNPLSSLHLLLANLNLQNASSKFCLTVTHKLLTKVEMGKCVSLTPSICQTEERKTWPCGLVGMWEKRKGWGNNLSFAVITQEASFLNACISPAYQ